MVSKSTYQLQFRRRREQKTNFVKRLNSLKSTQLRLAVRKSNNNISAQLISYNPKGDNVMASANSKELSKYGWKFHKGNIPSAYLTGLLIGLKAKQKKLSKAVLDIGLNTPVHGSVLFAALKGAMDAGLSIPANEDSLPSNERIQGKHIEDYANSLKEEELKQKFSACLKAGVNPKNFTKIFEKTKNDILKELEKA